MVPLTHILAENACLTNAVWIERPHPSSPAYTLKPIPLLYATVAYDRADNSPHPADAGWCCQVIATESLSRDEISQIFACLGYNSLGSPHAYRSRHGFFEPRTDVPRSLMLWWSHRLNNAQLPFAKGE